MEISLWASLSLYPVIGNDCSAVLYKINQSASIYFDLKIIIQINNLLPRFSLIYILLINQLICKIEIQQNI